MSQTQQQLKLKYLEKMASIRKHIETIQEEQIHKLYVLDKDSIRKIHGFFYMNLLLNEESIDEILINLNKQEKTYFNSLITDDERNIKIMRNRLRDNPEIIPSIYQRPHEFFQLLEIYEITKKYSKKYNGFIQKNQQINIVLASEASYHSHAKVIRDNNEFGFIFTSYLIMQSHLLAWFASLLIDKVQEKFNIKYEYVEDINCELVSLILDENPHLLDLLSRILVSSIATEQYNISFPIVGGKKSDRFKHITYAINLFFLNHEMGHVFCDHFSNSNSKSEYLTQENFNAFFPKVFSFVEDEGKAKDLTINYLKNFRGLHLDEIEADYFGLVFTLEVFANTKIDITNAWIGNAIALYLIKFIERVYFMLNNGFDYINIVKEAYLIDILFPSSHPRSNTRISCLLSNADLFDSYKDKHVELAQALHIPFSRASQSAIDILMKIRKTNDDYLVQFDDQGNLMFEKKWSEL